MNRVARGGVFAAICLFVISPLGCGPSGKKVVKVTGQVTRNGKPVPNVAVNFVPASGRPSWGMSDADGKFSLKYTIDQEGAEIDTHSVWIDIPPANPQEENDLATGKKQLPADMREIKKKYGDSAKPAIQVEVKDDGKPIEIKLD